MTKQPTTKNDARKVLGTLFKVLGGVASDDETRANLNHVHVRRICEIPGVVVGNDVVRMEATDGHALVRVDIPLGWLRAGEVALPDGFYQAKHAAALLSVGADAVPVADCEYRWPATDQVIPGRIVPGAALQVPAHRTAQHYNSALLADTLAAVGKIAAALSGDKRAIPTRIQLGDGELAPCRIDVRVACAGGPGLADIVGVAMPMRA
jgi:hypothetical protein